MTSLVWQTTNYVLNLIFPSTVNITLALFRSRWTRLWPCKYSRAFKISRATYAMLDSAKEYLSTASAKVPPCMYSITTCQNEKKRRDFVNGNEKNNGIPITHRQLGGFCNISQYLHAYTNSRIQFHWNSYALSFLWYSVIFWLQSGRGDDSNKITGTRNVTK